MKLILNSVSSIVGILLLVFLGAGFLSTKEFNGELSDTLVAPPQDIWALISTPEQRKARLPIDKITGSQQNSLGFQKWAEHRGDTVARYEILAYSQPFGLTLALMEGSDGLTGLFTYSLSSDDGIHTQLTIHEKSHLSGFTNRSIATLIGRDHGIRSELQSIKTALRKNALAPAPATTTSDAQDIPESATDNNTQTQ